MAKEAGKSAMSGKKSKAKHGKTKEMHIRRGTGGGYIVKHDMEAPDPSEVSAMGQDMNTPPAQEYPIANHADLQSHVAEHMPDQSEEMEDGAASAGTPGM